jgi:cysteinyl-tRNA synthetase
MQLHLTNTLTRRKGPLTPLNPAHVTMYACGPTVYDRPHIGNARSAVAYDVLFRTLSALYPRVTYVRNITDVDDKINARARERNITIQALTAEVTQQFHADMGALNVLRPTHEPRATEYIPQMIAMIETLIARGHAYVAEGHVLFAVATDPNYGCLSRRSRDDMIAGSRVEIAPYKKDPADFVLWKPAAANDDASSRFPSPWSEGRPGWHIECSAMSTSLLGTNFDIHGGGADLMFPHHENEIAQSNCAHPEGHYASTWVHNGFLTVNGEKMSKSLGNFITVEDLLARGVKGETIRFALMSTRYNEPFDWTDKLLTDAQKVMDRLYRVLFEAQSVAAPPHPNPPPQGGREISSSPLAGEVGWGGIATAPVLEALADDLNTPKALALLQSERDPAAIKAAGALLGLLQQNPQSWFQGAQENTDWIAEKIAERTAAKAEKNWAKSDAIRAELQAKGIILEDKPGGITIWRRA